jgi:hypothetical protein
MAQPDNTPNLHDNAALADSAAQVSPRQDRSRSTHATSDSQGANNPSTQATDAAVTFTANGPALDVGTVTWAFTGSRASRANKDAARFVTSVSEQATGLPHGLSLNAAAGFASGVLRADNGGGSSVRVELLAPPAGEDS